MWLTRGLIRSQGRDVCNLRGLPRWVSFHHATHSRAFQQHTRPAGLIGDQQHLRGVWIDILNFTYDSVRSNHGHLHPSRPSLRPLVDEDVPCLIGAGGANHLSGYGLVNIPAAKVQQFAQPLTCLGILRKARLLEAETVIFLLQT